MEKVRPMVWPTLGWLKNRTFNRTDQPVSDTTLLPAGPFTLLVSLVSHVRQVSCSLHSCTFACHDVIGRQLT